MEIITTMEKVRSRFFRKGDREATFVQDLPSGSRGTSIACRD